MNMSLIDWYSKKQSTKEMSVFTTEFVAMKVGIETLHAIQDKWMMMGIPISGCSYLYGGNISVIDNLLKPELAFKKKCNSKSYHATCKSVAMGELLTGHLRSIDNQADLLTKIVTERKWKHLVS